MKSYFFVTTPDSLALELRDVETPQPGPGQLLVKMHAASLNRGEFILGHGLTKVGQPKAGGMEGAGEIVGLGHGVQGFSTGQAVMGRCAGAYAEYALMDTREAMPVPNGMSMQHAAAIPLTYLVAHDLVTLQGHLQADQWCLIPGVSSGVGVASLQIAKLLGAKVIGTSGSQAKLDVLKPYGLDLGIVTREAKFAEQVMQATGNNGANLVVNPVGGTVFPEAIRCIAFQGRLGFAGYVDGQLNANLDLMTLHAKRLTLFGVSNKLRNAEQRAQGIAQFVREVSPAFADGRIKPLVYQVFAFNDLPQARALMESNQQNGKIVLAIA